MIVSDIVTRVTRVFGDDAQVQIQQADVIRWINDAQRDLALNNNLFRVTASSNQGAGVQTFTLPVGLFTLHQIKFNGITLRELSQQEADSYIVNNDDPTQNPQGVPTHYWRWGNTCMLYPVPLSAGTVLCYYTRTPVDVANPTDTPDVPLQYHNRLVEYCLTQAYELDDNLYGYQVKMNEYKDKVKDMKDNQEWENRDFYPHITASPGDAGNYYEGYWYV